MVPGIEHRPQPQEQQEKSCLQKIHDLINVQLKKKKVSQRNDLLHLGKMDTFERPDRAGCLVAYQDVLLHLEFSSHT